ncbi:hypothetical protein Q31a_25750 [Aureliella helgolandensis]|uniref:Uncharacterized protein n=1 Tax=Aureliella helgolandensis TaxID=2527968 RepID=A0A518G6P4_9BACT|nr:hypothetical protein Q31a_25750 [Aureliella helgolandensis]
MKGPPVFCLESCKTVRFLDSISCAVERSLRYFLSGLVFVSLDEGIESFQPLSCTAFAVCRMCAAAYGYAPRLDVLNRRNLPLDPHIPHIQRGGETIQFVYVFLGYAWARRHRFPRVCVLIPRLMGKLIAIAAILGCREHA